MDGVAVFSASATQRSNHCKHSDSHGERIISRLAISLGHPRHTQTRCTPVMAHCGIAVDHPANAAVVARINRSLAIEDRPRLIRRIEEMLADRPDPAVARALQKLRDDTPDPPRPASEPPGSVDRMALGTHPDIVDHLWSIGRGLPTDCCWVSYRQPVLAHSMTGVIFGLGIGTLGYALRLPPLVAAEAATAGATRTRPCVSLDGPVTFSLDAYGPDWWFGLWRSEEDHRWSHLAYEHFGAV